VPRAVTVLLGATQAGKTTLMRADGRAGHAQRRPRAVDGQDVTGVPVRQRNVAMVYQQFINYPSMTVFDNIASPLKLRGGMDKAAAIGTGAELASQAAHRALPAAPAGRAVGRPAAARGPGPGAGQAGAADAAGRAAGQPRLQAARRAAGRALALFAAGDSTVVYATTEPTEALLLGGYTAVMDAGELLQYGPTAEVFHRPQSIRVARAFSDPPMNLVAGRPPLGVHAARRPGWRVRCRRPARHGRAG
jgi:glycerol transport system ATP-binding protein